MEIQLSLKTTTMNPPSKFFPDNSMKRKVMAMKLSDNLQFYLIFTNEGGRPFSDTTLPRSQILEFQFLPNDSNIFA